jgi:hypothetical protein
MTLGVSLHFAEFSLFFPTCQVPAGALGSSQSKARLRAPSGTSIQAKGGDRFCPSQVKRRGIIAPSARLGGPGRRSLKRFGGGSKEEVAHEADLILAHQPWRMADGQAAQFSHSSILTCNALKVERWFDHTLQTDLVGACRAVPIETGARGGETWCCASRSTSCGGPRQKGFSSAAPRPIDIGRPLSAVPRCSGRAGDRQAVRIASPIRPKLAPTESAGSDFRQGHRRCPATGARLHPCARRPCNGRHL